MFQRVLKSMSMREQPKRTEAKEKKQLPGHITGKILDLENQCEKDVVEKKHVEELLSVYTSAIQFYEEAEDQRYKLYRKRMHRFLHQPLIQSVLKGQSTQMMRKKQENEEKVRNAENNVKFQARKLLQSQQLLQQHQQNKMNQEIQKQQHQLKERIRHKRTMSNREKKVNSSLNNEECEKKVKVKEKEIERFHDLFGVGGKRVFM